jgi:hypothetical protein
MAVVPRAELILGAEIEKDVIFVWLQRAPASSLTWSDYDLFHAKVTSRFRTLEVKATCRFRIFVSLRSSCYDVELSKLRARAVDLTEWREFWSEIGIVAEPTFFAID